MRILAFTDIHGSKHALQKLQQNAKKYKPDVIMCAGDFTIFERNMDKILEKLNKLGTVYLVHGNHETEADTRKACRKHKNLHYVHKKIVNMKGYKLIGYGGGGFSIRDKGFENYTRKQRPKGKIILLTHGPPRGTKLDYLDYFKEHAGCESYTKFIKKHKPILSISGHLHENFGKQDRIGTTKAVNPGPNGMIIEVP